MSYEALQRRISLVAAGDYTAKQFYAMTLDTTAAGCKATINSGSGDDIVGILQDKPDTGEVGSVCVDGITKAVAGTGGWTAGDNLMADGNGKLITATSGNAIVAKGLETALAGDIAAVLLQRGAANAA